MTSKLSELTLELEISFNILHPHLNLLIYVVYNNLHKIAIAFLLQLSFDIATTFM